MYKVSISFFVLGLRAAVFVCLNKLDFGDGARVCLLPSWYINPEEHRWFCFLGYEFWPLFSYHYQKPKATNCCGARKEQRRLGFVFCIVLGVGRFFFPGHSLFWKIFAFLFYLKNCIF
jgi:hypothetical protein